MSRTWRSHNHHGRLRNHRTNRRLARNRWRRSRRRNIRSLSRQGHNAPRRRCNRSSSRRSRRVRNRLRRSRSCRTCRRLRRHHGSRTGRWGAPRQRFRVLPLKDRLQRITRLGNVGEIERRLRFNHRLRRRTTTAAVLEVIAHLLGLVGLDRAGVRLWLGHANRNQSIQNWLALDFEFPCEIIDSNFAHPSLFVSSARLAVHISLNRSRNLCNCLYYPRNRNLSNRHCDPGKPFVCAAQTTSHGPTHCGQHPQSSFPGSHLPACRQHRSLTQSFLHEHPHRKTHRSPNPFLPLPQFPQ